MTDPSNSAEEAANRRGVPLRAFGDALSLPVRFGATALAAYDSDFADQTAALLCGAASIGFAKLYVSSTAAGCWSWRSDGGSPGPSS